MEVQMQTQVCVQVQVQTQAQAQIKWLESRIAYYESIGEHGLVELFKVALKSARLFGAVND
jgi:hypothetical protein